MSNVVDFAERRAVKYKPDSGDAPEWLNFAILDRDSSAEDVTSLTGLAQELEAYFLANFADIGVIDILSPWSYWREPWVTGLCQLYHDWATGKGVSDATFDKAVHDCALYHGTRYHQAVMNAQDNLL